MSLYSEREWADDQREFGDYLDERYLIDRQEHEAHAEGNEEEPDEVCGETREHDWRPGDPECRRCHADLSEWNSLEDCGCPRQIVADEGHQEGCDRRC